LGGGWYTAQAKVDPATREQMEHRTDWGDLLAEPLAEQPASPIAKKGITHE